MKHIKIIGFFGSVLILSVLMLIGVGYPWCRQASSMGSALNGVVFHPAQDVHFYVVIPTYNNEEWCIRNIQSLVDQSYPFWSAVILNDCSTDATSKKLHAYVHDRGLEKRITVIDNTVRCGACRNIYDAIHGSSDARVHRLPECPDAHVVVLCDGDDWFNTEHALARVALEYRDRSVWLTYGQYRVFPNNRKGHCAPYPAEVIEKRAFREFQPGAWMASHLRTFKAGLFKAIRKEDLMLNNEFLPVTWDVAMMAPMLEMCTGDTGPHFRFIGDDILYVYNTATPLNDYKQHFELQQRLDKYLRAQPKYAALKEVSW